MRGDGGEQAVAVAGTATLQGLRFDFAVGEDGGDFVFGGGEGGGGQRAALRVGGDGEAALQRLARSKQLDGVCAARVALAEAVQA